LNFKKPNGLLVVEFTSTPFLSLYHNKNSMYKSIFLALSICLVAVSCNKNAINRVATQQETISKPKPKETPTTAKAEILAFQKKLNEDYKNPDTSPLGAEASAFMGHEFFPIDLTYRVKAKFEAYKLEDFFTIPTSGPREAVYRKFGLLTFKIAGKKHHLTVYQNRDLIRNPIYKNYLFLPFTDATNGNSTYGGGRYIDMSIPKGKTVILDFNQAYNPYCAYVDGYSCPIPPAENDLDIAVEAGIMLKQ